MTNHKIGLSQAQQRRNHRHVMWVCRERVMRWAVGKMIAALEKMPSDSEVINLIRPHSYRGYYCDLAFELGEGKRPAWGLLAECKSAIGKVFEGYKGGNYIMKESTPVWIAEYGCSGVKLIALYEGGEYETEDDD